MANIFNSYMNLSMLSKILLSVIFGIFLGMLKIPLLIETLLIFNSLFLEMLNFLVPLIIFFLITFSIISFGMNSKKALIFILGIALLATIFVGIFCFFIISPIYQDVLFEVNNANFKKVSMLKPLYSIDLPTIFSASTAIVLSFFIGIGVVSLKYKSTQLENIILETKNIIYKLLSKFIVPLLPLYVLIAFANITYSSGTSSILLEFPKIIIISYIVQLFVIFLYFLVGSVLAKRNFFFLIKTMLPAYFTAIGTASSTATMPVTIESIKKLGVKKEIADFITPFCANTHMPGSIIHIVSYAVAIMIIFGENINLSTMIPFIISLSFIAIAAPGIPGGIIVTSIAALTTMLNFTEPMIALLVALPVFGTSTGCNVMTDGVLALLLEKYFLKQDAY